MYLVDHSALVSAACSNDTAPKWLIQADTWSGWSDAAEWTRPTPPKTRNARRMLLSVNSTAAAVHVAVALKKPVCPIMLPKTIVHAQRYARRRKMKGTRHPKPPRYRLPAQEAAHDCAPSPTSVSITATGAYGCT